MSERDQNAVTTDERDDFRFEDRMVIWFNTAPVHWLLGNLPPWGLIILLGWVLISVAAIGSGHLSWPPSWAVVALVAPSVVGCLLAILAIFFMCVKVLLWPFRMLWDQLRPAK